jgi:acyl-CoA synthetase (AMP-forming)/AMP-acid ligase II
VIDLDNSVEAAVSIFAALKAGAVFSVINFTTKAARLNCYPKSGMRTFPFTCSKPRRCTTRSGTFRATTRSRRNT